MSEFDEKKALELAQKCTEWHGCASGDCPHDSYRECFDAVHIEGQRDQHSKDQERIAELEQRSQDREATIVNLEAELEKFRNWYKLGCKESLDG